MPSPAEPSKPAKSVQISLRLSEEANMLLGRLKRRLSAERDVDLTLGDVVGEALQALDEKTKK